MPDNEELTTGTTGAAQLAEAPQFATAEYAHIPGTERCRICNNFVSGEYYRVNNQMACAKCALEARDGQPTDSHSAFARGLLLGIGGAILGLILYSTVGIVSQGWSIGYLGLAVGWLVGKAIMKGSNGVGGRRYQIAAVVLTYLAISGSSVPIIVAALLKRHSAGDIHWVAAIPILAKWAIASPFLELQHGFSGILGLVILFVGVSIASRLTAAKPLAVDGPYPVTS
jgi:hypothetical protein